ncbi:MAG: hypothetical protein HC933_02150 [Pleurocapsa sp. SU_196_0]|nr:hypothetical protein [Pleurocapsa sp. SU_196_0]
MSTYNPQTDPSTLSANSNGVRRVKEAHINKSDAALNDDSRRSLEPCSVPGV